MFPNLISVPVIMQPKDGECLAACAAMALSYLDITPRYERIIRLLKTQWFGTPFSNIQHLYRFKVQVELGKFGDFETITRTISNGYPLIASVQAGEFPHHDRPSDHAVVIVGIDEQYVYINDPMFAVAAIPVPKMDFSLAWLPHDESFAVITR